MSRTSAAFAAVLVTFALAGCGPEAEPVEADGAPAQAASDAPTAAVGDADAAGACPTVPQAGYELFTSAAVLAAPAEGAVYGDGTPISWTVETPPDATVDVEMSYINTDGDAIVMSGIFLDDLGNSEWGSSLNVFTSDADGRPGFMTLGMTYDADVTDSGATATHEVLGVYCVLFAVAD